MIRINLLPFRAARKTENIKRQASLFFLSLILTLIIILFLHINLSRKIGVLAGKVNTTKIELQKVKKSAAQVDAINKKLAILKKKMGIMKKLDTDRTGPVHLLDSFTNLIVANRMWFTSLDAGGKVIKVIGIALDNQTIADFMTRLEDSPKYTNVNLESTKQKIQGGLKLKSFAVTFTEAPIVAPGGNKAGK